MIMISKGSATYTDSNSLIVCLFIPANKFRIYVLHLIRFTQNGVGPQGATNFENLVAFYVSFDITVLLFITNELRKFSINNTNISKSYVILLENIYFICGRGSSLCRFHVFPVVKCLLHITKCEMEINT